MRTIDKLNKLADEFDRKIKKFSQEAFTSEDPKAMVTDAFFGTPHDKKNNETFTKYLSSPDSEFQKAIQDISGGIKIGAIVDANNKSADFLIECDASPKCDIKLKQALVTDYTRHFGLSPNEQFTKRLNNKTIRPKDINASVSDIIIF